MPTPTVDQLITPQTQATMLAQLLALLQKQPWLPLTFYAQGSFSASNGNIYVAMQPGTSGTLSAPSGTGNDIPDGTDGLVWAFLCPSNIYPAMPTTSWQPESVPMTFLQIDAIVMAFFGLTLSTICRSGFLTEADDPSLQLTSGPAAGTSPWVDKIAGEVFNRQRQQAATAAGYMLLTAATGVGPTNIQLGQLIATDPVGNRYTNSNALGANGAANATFSSGQIPASGTLSLLWAAQSPGSLPNIAPGTPLTLVTAIPGISISNPVPTPAVGWPPIISGSWLYAPGTDIESDVSLILDCINQWATLGTGSPNGAWVDWCIDAGPAAGLPSEVRFALATPTGFGTEIVTVYGNNAGVSPAGLAAIKTYLEARIPDCSTLAPGSPQNAIPRPVYVQIVVYGYSSARNTSLPAVQAAVLAAILATPVGGYPIVAGTPDQYGISNAQFVDACMNAGAGTIFRCTVAVSNDSGSTYVPAADFFMPNDPSTGIPVVAVGTLVSLGGHVDVTWSNV